MPVVTYLEKRKHQKRMLVYAFRLLAKYKWIEGVAGHITVRDPEFPVWLAFNTYISFTYLLHFY